MNQEHIMKKREPGATRFNRLRRIVPFVSGGVSLERVASNGVLRQFQSRVGLVPAPMDGEIDELARQNMREATRRLVTADTVNDMALVEVRPLVPAEALRGGLGKSALTAVQVVKDTLRDNGMSAIPNSHPVMPVERLDDEPIDDHKVWSTISGELDSLNHQARAERGVRNASLIMVTNPQFAAELFALQMVEEEKFTDQNMPLVLSRVGEEPRDHVFTPAA